MSGYYDLTITAARASSGRHTLNRHYRGASRFTMRAPDADGELVVWARSQREAEDHLTNALFDLLFARHRLGVEPRCPGCGGEGTPRGRNAAGRRQWQCRNPECRRWFGARREGNGGVEHPASSLKLEFYRLHFGLGVSVDHARQRLGISRSAAYAWRRRYIVLGQKWDKLSTEGD